MKITGKPPDHRSTQTVSTLASKRGKKNSKTFSLEIHRTLQLLFNMRFLRSLFISFAEHGNNYADNDEQKGSEHLRLIGRGTPLLYIRTDALAILEKIKMVLI